MVGLFVFALSDGLWFNLRQLYLAELGATASQVGLALSVASLAAAVVPIPAGHLCDRFGPRPLILVPWSMAALGTFVMSLAFTWQLATLGLVAYTLCVGANPALVSFVLQNLPVDGAYGSTERALTTVFGVYPLTLVVAPALGGAIASRWGLRTDLRLAMVGFSLAVVLLATAKSDRDAHRLNTEDSVPLVRNRSFLVQMGYFTLTLTALYLGYLLIPNYLEETRGYSRTLIGSLFSVLSFGTVLSLAPWLPLPSLAPSPPLGP
jgi:MFS family permease